MMVQLPDNERKNMTMMTATQALSVNPATGQTLAAMPWLTRKRLNMR